MHMQSDEKCQELLEETPDAGWAGVLYGTLVRNDSPAGKKTARSALELWQLSD